MNRTTTTKAIDNMKHKPINNAHLSIRIKHWMFQLATARAQRSVNDRLGMWEATPLDVLCDNCAAGGWVEEHGSVFYRSCPFCLGFGQVHRQYAPRDDHPVIVDRRAEFYVKLRDKASMFGRPCVKPKAPCDAQL